LRSPKQAQAIVTVQASNLEGAMSALGHERTFAVQDAAPSAAPIDLNLDIKRHNAGSFALAHETHSGSGRAQGPTAFVSIFSTFLADTAPRRR
jgi:hypothetical protein